MKLISSIFILVVPFVCTSCVVEVDPEGAPAYAVYQRPVSTDYDDYHKHGDHHHHHDSEQREHYHPDNQWDRLAYRTANDMLSSQDIDNLNAMTDGKKKNP